MRLAHLLVLVLPALPLPLHAADYLSPMEAAKTFHVTDPELTWELVLAEPDIAQPVFINWDERGRLWVCEYRQYPAPAGLTAMSHDEFWRTVYDKVPEPPPRGVRGADRITIHEDTKGDGHYDKHTVFLDGLNLCTSIEHGRGGHFVLQPPYLLFYADKNHDDIPDGPPEILLAGFGIEDTHSLANSLRWGPDGWLYGAHGSTVTSRLTRPGLDEPGAPPALTMVGQGIWRYQPETHRVEVFAEGGGNTFGVEFDAQGRLFSGHNGGDTRGFEYVQGAYERKGFEKHGQLSNPYAYGFYEPMKSDKTERFTHNFIIYEGGALGAKYEGKLFGIEPLQGRLVLSERYADASTFGTHDLGRIVTSDDKWFRPVDIKAGPDGAIYVADFHEPEISHLKHRSGPVYSETGRIWRLRGSTLIPSANRELLKRGFVDVGDFKTALGSSNKWTRQTALRVAKDQIQDLIRMMSNQALYPSLSASSIWPKNVPDALDRRARMDSIAEEFRCKSWSLDELWFIAAAESGMAFYWNIEKFDGLGVARATREILKNPNPDVRAWLVRILGDSGREMTVERSNVLDELARTEPNSSVRLQLAASARRLPAAQCLPIIRELLLRDEDAKDPRIPLMLWWAIESKCGGATDRDTVLALFQESILWDHPIVRDEILERLMRRLAQSGTRPELLACAQLLDLAPAPEHAKRLMTGFELAFKGRSLATLPDELARAIAKRGGASLPLRLRLGDPAAKATALQLLTAPKANEASVTSVLSVLSEIKVPEAHDPLLALLERPYLPPAVESVLYPALQQFDDPEIATKTIALLRKTIPSKSSVQSASSAPSAATSPSIPPVFSAPASSSAAFTLLAARPQWSRQLAEAVKSGDIPREAVPTSIVRRLKLHHDPALLALANDLWPGTGSPTTAETEKSIARLSAIAQAPGGNPYAGHDLFTATCSGCHRLHGEGGQIGPDLTSYQRDNLSALLTAIVNPSAEIREGYENLTLTTRDGRTLAGFLAEHDDHTLALRGLDGQTTVLPLADIATKTPSGASLMPEGLLNAMTDPQIRDLFAYLRSTQPLPGKRK